MPSTSLTARRVATAPECCLTATAGLAVPVTVESVTVMRPCPLRQMPLPPASRTVHARMTSSPCSAITTPDVPRSRSWQETIWLSPEDVTTTPAPAGLRTSQPRISTVPLPVA